MNVFPAPVQRVRASDGVFVFDLNGGAVLAHSDLVQSVLRAADVLEIVGGSAEGVTLSEISGRLCLKPPTVHNLLRTLVERGLLERGRRPIRYRIGGAFYELARTSFERSLACRAREVIQRLLVESGATSSSFAELVGGEVCLVLRVDQRRPDYVEGLGGRPLHPYASGSSLVYQAFMSAGDLSHYRERHPFSVQGAPLWGTIESLDLFLSDVRAKGVAAVPFGESEQRRVSAPVRHIDGSISGALTCVFVDKDGSAEPAAAGQAELERLKGIVRGLAEELSVGRLEGPKSITSRTMDAERHGALE